MHPFSYERPSNLGEALRLLEELGPQAQIIAGGTDLVIGLRDYALQPDVVVDLKRIPELAPAIRISEGRLVISAGTVMSDIERHPVVLERFRPLAESAAVVGSVQIRNRATLAGNICNASPAADTAPPLLVYDADVVVMGSRGERRIPIDDFFVRSGQTTMSRGELVSAIELPLPARPTGGAYTRLTRRRGTDLASITLAATVNADRVVRLAYGSVGPRPLLFTDPSGILADPEAPQSGRDALLEEMLSAASPSATSVRASREYRVAMLRVLAARALETAARRLSREAGA